MMMHLNCKELTVGQRMKGYYILLGMGYPKSSYGEPYFCGTALDRSGTIELRCWDNGRNRLTCDDIGEVVYIEGEVKSFGMTRQICCDMLLPTGPEDMQNYDLEDLLPEREDMRDAVVSSIAKIQDVDYHDLCLAVIDRCCEEYLSYPGGYNQHHAMPGGLAAHSCSMAALADALAAQYGTELNADLLRAGCLLHDIGKIRMYTLASTGFSKGYRAKEHTEAGAKMVLEVGRSLHILESKLQMVVHLIRHHHEDKKDTDGTVQPSPPEVFALRKLDKMDSEMDSLLSTRRGIRDGEFTGYNRHLRRNISFAA